MPDIAPGVCRGKGNLAFGVRKSLNRLRCATVHGVVFTFFVQAAAADSMLAAGAGYDHLLTKRGAGHADRGKLSLR
jgi:hypothetical protein